VIVIQPDESQQQEQQQPQQQTTYEGVVDRIQNILGGMRSDTKEYGSSSAILEPLPVLSTGEVDYEGVLTRVQVNLRNMQRSDETIGLIQDRKNVNNLRNRLTRPGTVLGDRVELPQSGEEIDWFLGPEEEQQQVAADTNLTDEDVGLADPSPSQTQPERRLPVPPSQLPLWKRVIGKWPSITQNPEYKLPTQSGPTTTTLGPEPVVPTVDIPTYITNDEQNQNNNDKSVIPQEEDAFQYREDRGIVYVHYGQASPPTVPNIFPIFASGMTLSALLWGAFVFLL